MDLQRKQQRLRSENWPGQGDIERIMKEGVEMSKAAVKYNEVKEILMKDEAFKEKYDKLKPHYDLISQIIEARTIQNLTQEELALRVGTQNQR